MNAKQAYDLVKVEMKNEVDALTVSPENADKILWQLFVYGYNEGYTDGYETGKQDQYMRQ